MQELLELQTGQVSFLSGLLAGFSVTVAANVLQVENSKAIHKACVILLLMSTILFLIALYVDVRLTIEVATIDKISDETSLLIEKIRVIGTTSATMALVVFVIAIGMLGWLAGKGVGIVSTLISLIGLSVLGYVWYMVYMLKL